jgi:hypothetical protein
LLQTFALAVGAILRGADEHFHEVVVERVEELALEAPFELRVVEIARVHIKVIGVDGDGFIFEINEEFDAFAFGASREIQQRVFVEAKLGQDAVKPGVRSLGHFAILAEGK